LLTILKLIAPIMPFITEEIYQERFRKFEKIKSIHLMKWPKAVGVVDAKEFDLFVSILGKVRQEKTKAKKPMNAEIILSIEKGDYKKLSGMLDDLKDVVNAREIKVGKFGVEVV